MVLVVVSPSSAALSPVDAPSPGPSPCLSCCLVSRPGPEPKPWCGRWSWGEEEEGSLGGCSTQALISSFISSMSNGSLGVEGAGEGEGRGKEGERKGEEGKGRGGQGGEKGYEGVRKGMRGSPHQYTPH